MSTALVVGGGPNGLAAAISLAAEGVQVTVLEAADEVGGGARSSEAIIPGLLHDHCSAIHPMAVGSQFLSSSTCTGTACRGAGRRSIASTPSTAAAPACCTARWSRPRPASVATDRGGGSRSATRPPGSTRSARTSCGPLLRIPHHPLMLARFGAPTVLPASTFARVFRTEEGRALFGGVAAHAFRPLHYPMTSAIGMGIIAAGHRHGWAVAEGGSQSITNAMVALLGDLGGKIETGVRVQTASQLPPADVTMFDLAPSAVAGILGDRLPRRISRAFTRFRRGPGAFKVDFAVEGGVPWTNPDAHRAGTVHLAGTYSELAATEREIHAGRMPERPFVLVGQQYLADPATLGGQYPPGVELRARPQRLHRRRDRGDHRPDRAVRARFPGTHRRPHSSLDDADGRLQPQLRRRRHHDRRQGHSPADVRAANHAVAVHHWAARHVHLLGGHPAGTRRARHVRRQRRHARARLPGAATAPKLPTPSKPINSGALRAMRSYAWRRHGFVFPFTYHCVEHRKRIGWK